MPQERSMVLIYAGGEPEESSYMLEDRGYMPDKLGYQPEQRNYMRRIGVTRCDDSSGHYVLPGAAQKICSDQNNINCADIICIGFSFYSLLV